MKLLILTVCLVAAVSAFHNDILRVKLNHGGGIEGKYMTTNKGRGIVGFTGIPFAEAPIGNLRFSDPVTKAGWTGFYNGRDKENVVCPQYNTWGRDQDMWMGQEDCLYMNVYVPMNIKNNKYDMKNLPVLFYMHGGGFTMGNGNVKFVGPDYLLDNDVILVTGNYRLGALGFFTVDNDKYTGNYGLKDQHVMLKWVQDNIQHFGGDRNKVTVFGDGAGAASIGFHMMSPMSKGLFHQAILQGGTQYNQWALQDKQVAVRNAKQLLNKIGCNWNNNNNVNDFNEIQRCIRTKNLNDIMRVTQNLYDWHNDPMVTFGPVIETQNGNNNNFLTQDVYTNKNYWGNDIKCVVGFNNDAGAFKWISLLNDKNLMNDVTKNFDNVIPHMFYFNHLDNQNKQKVNNMLRDFYFKNKDMNNVNDIQQGFINMVTDGWFLSGIDEFVYNRLQNNKNTGNTFVFLFNYRGEGSNTDYMLNRMQNHGDFAQNYHNKAYMGLNDNDYYNKYNFGVSNNDNMLYTFPFTKNVMNHRVMNHNDDMMKDLITKMWFNFATNGNPNLDDHKWTYANKYPVDYFRFGNFNKDTWFAAKNQFGNGNDQWTSGMQNGLFDDRVNFWRQINTIRNHNNQNYNKFMKNEL